MLYGQHRAFQTTIMSTFFFFRLDCKLIRFIYLFVADWHKIGEQRQSLTNQGNQHENAKDIDYNYKVGDKVLLINEGILRKAESAYGKEPWTITTVHTNRTIRIQHRTRMEQLSIQRVQPFTDDIL